MSGNTKLAKSIAERAAKARLFSHTLSNGWTVQLKRPSDLQLEESIALNSRFGSQVSFKRDQVYGALQGWTGPKMKDVDPDAVDAAGEVDLPFDPLLTPLLFEDRTDILNEIADKLVESYNERKAARSEAEKN